jgi:hypothetical protein
MTRSLSSGREPRSANAVGNQGNRSVLDHLVAAYGLIAIVLMLLIRIKDLFKVLGEQIAPQQRRLQKD